jgi:outer membrane receptor protein involved in Fe transport
MATLVVSTPRIRPVVVALGIVFSSQASGQALPTVTVQGTLGEGYQAATAQSTTRDAASLKDIAASIQVVPHDVLSDRGITPAPGAPTSSKRPR